MNLYPVIVLVIMACWLGLAVTLAASARLLGRELFPTGESKSVPIYLGLITLLGVLVRIWMVPPYPMMSVHGDFNHVLDAFAIASGDAAARFDAVYPLALAAPAGMIMRVTGLTAEVLFGLTTLLGALLPPLLFGVARLLWGRSREGLVTALLGALYPPLLTFAGSGVRALPGATLAVLALLAFITWLQTGRLRLLATALFAAILLVQTRSEAVLFALPLLASFTLFRDRKPWHTLVSPASVATLVVGLVLLVPYFATEIPKILDPPESTGTPGFHGFAMVLVRWGFAVALFFLWGLKARKRDKGLSWALAGLVGLYVLFLQYRFGAHIFDAGALPCGLSGAQTYTSVPVLFFNPKLTPLALVLGYLATFSLTGERNERHSWLLLHLWLVPGFAISTAKGSGELPFEGMRTSLLVAPAFLLLAARGLCALSGFFRMVPQSLSRRRLARIAGLVLAAATFVAPLSAATDGNWNQQREYLFVNGWMADLPTDCTLVYGGGSYRPELPSGGRDEIDLEMMFQTRALLAAAAQPLKKNLRLVPVAQFRAASPADFRGPVFFFEGLECHRTGTAVLTPACAAMHDGYHLERHSATAFDNRMYATTFISDIGIDGDKISLALYRVAGPLPGGQD